MRAAQLQAPAPPQQPRTHAALAQLPPLSPLSPDQPVAGFTPLKQHQLAGTVGFPVYPAAHPSAARLPAWPAAAHGAAAAMPADAANLELSEETLFREDVDGQDPAVGDDMSSDGGDDAQLTPQRQQPAAGGTPSSALRSTPGLPGGGGGGGDSGSDSSDEDIGTEFAQAAELHRSSSAGALTGSAPQSPTGALAPGTPGSGSVKSAPRARTDGGAGGGQGAEALEQLIPAFGATPARPRRPVSTPSPTPVSRKKLAMDPAASKLGTSVPIAIPMGLREERDSTPDSPEEPGGIHAATFVPPHMLQSVRSGTLDTANLAQGTSPAASLKRERLVHRNAILRRTGFLEGSQGAAFLETMDPIRESAFESTPPLPMATPGALSRALGTAAGSSM